MTIKEAKEIDMVDYLATLGFQPSKTPTGNDYWYISPLGDEKTPSFKVNRILNRWYDFREGRGGNLVDFGIAYYKCSVTEILKKLSGSANTISRHQKHSYVQQPVNKSIRVVSAHPIASFSLLRYLQSRHIHDEVANKYLLEIRYKLADKIYYALGFRNDSGGYELRNEKFKGSSSPKDSTLIEDGAQELAVFEGFFNFLSFQTLYYNREQPKLNFLILNSTAFFHKKLPLMQQYKSVHLYLDNDRAGQNCTLKAQSIDPELFKDERSLYQQHGDLNDWLIYMSHASQQQIRPSP